jgi:hypothetical protein
MNEREQDRLKELLRQALPAVEIGEAGRDLWPAMMDRLEARPPAPPWFDWALACGLLALAAIFPASIPVFLYYL